MTDWQPISEAALRKRISQGVARLRGPARRLWDAIRIEPEKWELAPYGDAGGGFWAVAVIGQTVIWYNDIEEGFNRSSYERHGAIRDYWCNQDELDSTIGYLLNSLETGSDLVRMRKPPEPVR